MAKVLDAEIWSRLPSDIHLKLFEHLPLPALLCFQVVCKAWYNGIRNIERDCYIARVVKDNSWSMRVYSSRLHEETLHLPQPPREQQRTVCTTRDGGLYSVKQFEERYVDKEDGSSYVYNIFTRKMVSIPAPSSDIMEGCQLKIAHVVGDRDGELTIIRVVSDGGYHRWMLVFESERGTWTMNPLQLPPEEEFSMSPGTSHATIDGSILYFLTVNVQSQKMSALRSIDFRRNVDGSSTELIRWPSLPPLIYKIYQHPYYHSTYAYPHGRPFTGNIAIAGGKLFIACMRRFKHGLNKRYTVALLACAKQGTQWEFESEMPLINGFVPWNPGRRQHVVLRSRGDVLIVCNPEVCFACLYNTSTKAWSLFGRGDRDILDVCPLKLSLGCTDAV